MTDLDRLAARLAAGFDISLEAARLLPLALAAELTAMLDRAKAANDETFRLWQAVTEERFAPLVTCCRDLIDHIQRDGDRLRPDSPLGGIATWLAAHDAGTGTGATTVTAPEGSR